MAYGANGFAQKKVQQALDPLREALQQNTARGQAVAEVHQTMLKIVGAKLDLLKTGGDTSGVAWKGPGVEAMSASFGDISNVLQQLGDQIQHDGTQAHLNEICLYALAGIVVVGSIILLLDIAATAVVTVGTAGVGIIPMIAIDGAVVAGDIALMLTLVGIDFAIWLLVPWLFT